jgi:hypothetical protein
VGELPAALVGNRSKLEATKMTEKEKVEKLISAIKTIDAEYEHGNQAALGAAILYALDVTKYESPSQARIEELEAQIRKGK